MGALAALLAVGCGVLVAPQPGAPATDTSVARGAVLYAAHCQVCHGDREGAGGLPGAPVHGPDGHTWHHPDRWLIDVVLNGSGEMGDMMRRMMGIPPETPRMPAWRGTLSEDEVRAILALIKSWWTPEQRAIQERAR